MRIVATTACGRTYRYPEIGITSFSSLVKYVEQQARTSLQTHVVLQDRAVVVDERTLTVTLRFRGEIVHHYRLVQAH